MTNSKIITVAYGDGVGPEITEACLHILQQAGADISVQTVEAGERIYKQGAKDGIVPSNWRILEHSPLLLLGPVMIPDHKKCQPIHQALAQRLDLRVSQKFDSNLLEVESYLPPTTSQLAFGYQTTGKGHALFTSTDQPAPKLAGKNIANPTAMLQAALLMLKHLEQHETAARIHSAWVKTMQDGIHTKDMYTKNSKEKVGTLEFAEAITQRL